MPEFETKTHENLKTSIYQLSGFVELPKLDSNLAQSALVDEKIK